MLLIKRTKSKSYKTFYGILFVSLLIFLGNCRQISQPGLRSTRGVIDLRSVNFDDKFVLKLDGEWSFYWMQLYEPGDFQAAQVPPGDYVNVPGGWLKYQGDKYKPTRKGYATYHLKMLMGELDIIELRTPPISMAFKCWLNDSLVASQGRVATSEKESRPSTAIKSITFPVPRDGVINITVQISNYEDPWGGPYNSFLVGSHAAIWRDRSQSEFYESIFLGIMFIFAVYHLFLFMFWKKDLSTLLFGCCCALLAYRSLLIGTKLISVLPILIDSWTLGIKMNYHAAFFSAPLILAYFYFRYREESSLLVVRLVLIFSTLLSLGVIFTPYKIFVYMGFIFHGVVVLCILYLIQVFIRALIHKRKGILITAFAYVFFSFTMVCEMLHLNDVIHTANYTGLGFTVLILSQALVIARRFSLSFKKAEEYSRQLQIYSGRLEEKVRERTAQLEKATEKKTNFFINFTHEIKTPLSIIDGFLDKDIRNRGTTPELALAEQNLSKLRRDVINFLDIEKLNKGQDFYDHNQIINLSYVLEHKTTLFLGQAEHKKIKLSYSTENKDFYTKIDPSALDRVINNLVGNAILYTPAGGNVILSLTQSEKCIELIIQDTGIGMSPKQKENLFKPYFQLSHTKRNIQGMGVGLSIVKKILDQIGVVIHVESEKNIGTRFRIFFDSYNLNPGDHVVQDGQYSQPPRNVSHVCLKEEPYRKDLKVILIVEDNPNMLFYLLSSLKDDYNLFFASDGSGALQRLEEIPLPDLIISDIMMDGMDGYQFYEILVRNLEYSSIPFFFLTARATEKDMIKGISKGAVNFIFKPFSMSVLKARIKATLKHMELVKEREVLMMEGKISRLLHKREENLPSPRILYSQFFREHKMTPREIDVALLLIRGWEYKAISSHLNISINTLKPYVTSIYQKLDIHNKVELTNLIRQGEYNLRN